MSRAKILAALYFFGNTVGLPAGLTFTGLLSPFIALWLALRGYLKHMLLFAVCWVCFAIAHTGARPDWATYLSSSALLFSTYLFGLFVFHFSKQAQTLSQVFTFLTRCVFIASLISICLYLTPLRHWVWKTEDVTPGLEGFSRLTLFTYEPSYFATLLVPLWFFAFWNWAANPNRQRSTPVLILLLAFLLAFSLGVIAIVALSTAFCFLLDFRKRYPGKRVLPVLLLVLLVGAVVMFTENPLRTRIDNVLKGEDHSGMNRTVVPYTLAIKINEMENPLWGVGFGQIKIKGDYVIREQWPVWAPDEPVRIPNVLAESIACAGYIGFVLRFLLLIWLFFASRVYRNYYQLSMFVFAFLYQFQGSFMTSLAEATLWALAANPSLVSFNRGEMKLLSGSKNVKPLLEPAG